MLDLFANFWEGILSRQPKHIRTSYLNLDEDERQVVLAHLQRMVGEPDWHPAQVESAQIALRTISELENSSKEK
jgi:hypothetical protein